MFACVLKLCNFSIVGAGALDSPLEGVIKSSCRKHYVDNTNEIADEMSEGRDVGGAVPYKRDRIVFCSVLQWL